MEFLQQISAVAIVFLLLGSVIWFLRKHRSAALRLPRLPWLNQASHRQSRQLQLLDRLPLTPQHALHMVRVNELTYLVATHAGGAALLQVPAPASFQDALATAIQKPDSKGVASCGS